MVYGIIEQERSYNRRWRDDDCKVKKKSHKEIFLKKAVGIAARYIAIDAIFLKSGTILLQASITINIEKRNSFNYLVLVTQINA